MTDYENPMNDYWPNSEGREAEQMRVINYPDTVRVAIHFAPPDMLDREIVGRIMKALGGKANPTMLYEEIKQQRKA